MTDRLRLLENRLVGLIVPAAADRILEAPDVEIVLREIEVLLVVRDSIQLHAVDRVALAARERRIRLDETVVEGECGLNRRVQQMALAGRYVVGRRHLEPSVPGSIQALQAIDGGSDLPLQPRVRFGLEREDCGLEHVAAEPARRLGELSNLDGDRDVRVEIDLRLPEAVTERDAGVSLGANRIVEDGRVGLRGYPHVRSAGRRGRLAERDDSADRRGRLEEVTTIDRAHSVSSLR